MSSENVTLVDYGADIGEPVSEPTVLASERDTTETTRVELDAFDSKLQSGVSERTLHALADEASSVDHVVDELKVDIPTAREDLAAIDRLDGVQTPFEAEWGVSQATLRERALSHGLDADGPRERFCEECGNRVTVMSDGQREAGHQKGERPDEAQCSQFIGGDA